MRLKFIEPMSPTLIEVPPEGADSIHELKYDGYRTQLVLDEGGVRAFSRRGTDWTAKDRPIVEAAAALPATSAIIHGELNVCLRSIPPGSSSRNLGSIWHYLPCW